MNKFDDKTVCLDLTNTISYKKKKTLIELITTNGGKVTFILTPKTDLIVKENTEDLDSYKCRNGFARNIPVVPIEYVHDLLSSSQSDIDIADYSLINIKLQENLKKGIVSAGSQKNNTTATQSKKRPIDISKLKFNKESEDPYSEEFEKNGYNVIKWIIAKVNF